MPFVSESPAVSATTNSDYTPISCTFHDRLEDYSVRGSTIPVQFMENGVLVETEAQIIDVFAKDGADFAKLALINGTEVVVRLDRLLAVNGFELPPAC